MIDQQLIDTVQDSLDFDIEIDRGLVKELLNNYIKVIEDNTELHKELAKIKSQSFNFSGGIKCSDIPDNLAM